MASNILPFPRQSHNDNTSAALSGEVNQPETGVRTNGRPLPVHQAFVRSAEMTIATAIFSVLPDELREKVRRKVETIGWMTDSLGAADALSILARMK